MANPARVTLLGLAVLLFGTSSNYAACDELAGRVLTRYLRPVIEDVECSILGKAGLDKKGHKLTGLCYESNGLVSHISLDATLNCRSGDDSVLTKILGKSAPSISEDVTVRAEVRGIDCTLTSVHVSASGEIGKILASGFDADGRARTALEQGLSDICRR